MYQVCTRKNILQAPSFSIYVVFEFLVHNRNFDDSTQVGVEPVNILTDFIRSLSVVNLIIFIVM